MRGFKWNAAHAVFLGEVDAEHRAIYQAAGDLQQAIQAKAPRERILELMRGVVAHAEDHFSHEERLMRSAHYESFAWHEQQHDAARKRLAASAARIENGEYEALEPLLEFLSGWL